MKNLKFAFLVGAAITMASCNSKSTGSTETTDSTDTATTGMDHSSMTQDSAGISTNPMVTEMMAGMQKMEGMTMSGNGDLDFVNMMIVHHQGAVKMSQMELDNGKDAQIRNMAEKIVQDQQKEIEELQAISKRLANGAKNYNPEDQNNTFVKSMKMDHSKIEAENEHATASTDHQFVGMMIMHHQQAIDMSKGYLPIAKDSEVRKIAQTIIDKQAKEISQFKAWFSTQH